MVLAEIGLIGHHEASAHPHAIIDMAAGIVFGLSSNHDWTPNVRCTHSHEPTRGAIIAPDSNILVFIEISF